MDDFVKKMRDELNDEQFAAATHTVGPLVVTACAGSGKTHTLASRVRYLRHVDPDARILMISFTRNAANEMESRVNRDGGVQTADKKVCASTYHGFCYTLLSQYGKFANINVFNVIKPSAYKDYMKAAAGQHPDFYTSFSGRSYNGLAALYSNAINSMQSVTDVIRTNDDFEDFFGLDNLAEALKIDTDRLMRSDSNGNALTYDDLLSEADKLLDNPMIARKVASTYKYIMVDEYQDTNNLQESILLKLARFNQNIMVVGDASQSIYGFRAANVRIIQEFDKRFYGAKVLALPKTYRCTQEICDFANRVMKSCSWNYCNMVSAFNKHGKRPRLYIKRDAASEAMFVLEKIFKYLSDGYKMSDIGILSRSSLQTTMLEVELGKRNIPFNKYGGVKFLEHRCIVSVMSYLTLLVNPYDLPSIQNVLCVEQGIGDSTASKIAIAVNQTHAYELVECYKQSGLNAKQRASITKFCTFLNSLKLEQDFHKRFSMVAKYYTDTWRNTILNSNRKDKDDALDELRQGMLYINQLEAMSMDYDSVMDFINDVNVNALDGEDASCDKLTISTVHSAKGMEWKVVILMSCYEGGFPSHINPSEYGTSKDEEELRCFYVAITRASEELIMTMPENVFIRSKGFAANVHADPSHYLANAFGTYDIYREKRLNSYGTSI